MKRSKWFYVYFILILLISPAPFLFSEDQEIDFNIDWSDEDEKTYEKKTLYIKHADQIQSSSIKDKAGYSLTHLDGNVFIIFEDKKIFSDQMTIKMLDDKAEEIIASGNVFIESDKSITIGQKFFFYPNKKTGIVYQAETYNKPYFIRGEYFKFKDENKLIASNMTFSNCENPYPHYSIGAVKGWVYKGEQDFFLGFSIRAGEDPIFFFPFMHRSYYGTGLITSLGKEEGAGYFINNTYKTQGTGYNLKVMLDHYQKTGDYIGAEYSRSDIGNLLLKQALIYDRHVKYDASKTAFVNFFEEVPGQGATSGRSLRYKSDSSYDRSFQFGSNFSTNLKGTFYIHSDPSISSQYESSRLETFDVSKLIFPDPVNSAKAGSWASGTGQGKQMTMTMNNTIYGVTLNISGAWVYQMSKTDDPVLGLNSYSPDYYKNYLSSITWPQITAQKTFNLFDLLAPAPQAQNQTDTQNNQQDTAKNPQEQKWALTWPLSLNATGNYKESKTYTLGIISTEGIERKVDLGFNFPLTAKLGVFTFMIPFSLSNSTAYNKSKTYSSGSLSSDINTRIISFRGDSSLSFEWRWKYSLLTSKIPLNLTYSNNKQETNFLSYGDSVLSDRQGTYASKNYQVGNDSSLGFLQDYEYLESTITAKINYNNTKKYGDYVATSTQSSKSYGGGFSTLKTTVTLDTSDSYNNDGLGNITNIKNPYDLRVDSKLIPYLTISESHRYDRSNDKSMSNTLSLNASVPTKLYFSRNFWLNSLTLSTTWTKDYINYFSDNLTYSLALDFNITKLWQISLTTSGSNSKLYRYTSKAEEQGEEKKDFWDDLYKSVKLWSKSDRQITDFKMGAFGFNIKHDLHKWTMELTTSFTPRLSQSGAMYFESVIGFQLTMTDLSGFFTPKKIEKRFGQQY